MEYYNKLNIKDKLCKPKKNLGSITGEKIKSLGVINLTICSDKNHNHKS